MNDASINWRNLAYNLTMQLIRKVQNNCQMDNANRRCLIVDDTDLPKTGCQIKLIRFVAKKAKRSKLLEYLHAETIVDFKDIQVKLYFCKSSKKGNWNDIMTTNTELTFDQAYKIYSTRWSVEVFFKERKQATPWLR